MPGPGSVPTGLPPILRLHGDILHRRDFGAALSSRRPVPRDPRATRSWAVHQPKAPSSRPTGPVSAHRAGMVSARTVSESAALAALAGGCSPGGDGVCSTPEGVIVSTTGLDPLDQQAVPPLLNARGRHRLDHLDGPISSKVTAYAAQRPRASSSRPRRAIARAVKSMNCSTPEGVIVSTTQAPPPAALRHLLLNARGRHRLDHRGGRWRRQDRAPAAQRPRASSSRPPSAFGHNTCRAACCSTPDGVIVSTTPARPQGYCQLSLMGIVRRRASP
jgi:hypothetical protein